MIHVFKDTKGKVHRVTDDIEVDYLVDILSGDTIGYMARVGKTDIVISKEVYEALQKYEKPVIDPLGEQLSSDEIAKRIVIDNEIDPENGE